MAEIYLTDQEYDSAITELTMMIDTKKNMTYTINFRSEYPNSKIIRDFVGRIFDAFHIENPWRGRFILITDELINNSIEHGSQEGDINCCIITAGTQYENGYFHISLEVHDTGRGKNHEKISEEIEAIKAKKDEPVSGIYMEKRGRGLFHITEKIVDKLTFGKSEKGGLAVKIEKCITTENNETCKIGHTQIS